MAATVAPGRSQLWRDIANDSVGDMASHVPPILCSVQFFIGYISDLISIGYVTQFKESEFCSNTDSAAPLSIVVRRGVCEKARILFLGRNICLS